MPKEIKRIVSEEDRAALREYLTKRLRAIRRSQRTSPDTLADSFAQGAELELLFAFDELLNEEPPDLRKKPVAQ